MKRFYLFFTAFILFAALNAQNFTISGHVTNNLGTPVANHQVCVNSVPLNSTIPFSQCVFTNNTGFYSITIPNGAVTGPNQQFVVSTYDCNSTLLTQTVSNMQGTISSAVVNFTYCTVPLPCSAAFNWQQSGLNVAFYTTNNSSNITLNYLWDFGDGNTSTLSNPTHTYSTPGTYTVCLVVSNVLCSDTVCQNVVVGLNTNCNLSFTYDTTNLAPLQIQFFGNVNPAMATSQWVWNFGDGVTLTGQQNPVHQYQSPGTYNVCAYIIQAGAILCQYCMNVNVYPVNPPNCIANFTYSSTSPGTYTFTGYFSPMAPTTQWLWNFGDGTTGMGQTVTHNYAYPGTYNVCLTVTSTSCPPVTVCQTITVSGNLNPCNANFIYQQTGATVQFYYGNPTINNLTVLHWDFGDGNTSSQINPVHTYAAPGTYQVCLTVQDLSSNCITSTFCQTIYVGSNTATCQPSFTYMFGSIYNVAFFGNFSPMSNSVQWHWDFGDNTTSNLQNPVHSFPGPGTYNVCLSVITPAAICPTVTVCQTITIQGNTSSCNALFNYQVNNTNVYFYPIGASVNTGYVYAWDFGDGNTSSLQNPVHTYASYGTYTVCLTVTDPVINCTDQYCQQITLGNSGSFGGQVFAGNNGADIGTVYLLTVVPTSTNTNPSIIPVASTPILPGGYYMFQNIPYGNYIIQAHLDPASIYFFNYLPTYYGDVLFWSQATFISVGPVNVTLQYDIHLVSSMTLTTGPGQIAGVIVPGGNKDITSVENILVLLLDENDQPFKYTYSDASGHFAFTGLPFGTYKLQAEVWGKNPVPALITLDSSNPEVTNVVIVLNDETVVTGFDGNATFFVAGNVLMYPNPAQDALFVEFNLTVQTMVQFEVYNITGQKVYTESFNCPSGINRVVIKTESFAEGMYLLRCSSDNAVLFTKSFIRLKY